MEFAHSPRVGSRMLSCGGQGLRNARHDEERAGDTAGAAATTKAEESATHGDVAE